MKLITYGPNCHGLVADNGDSTYVRMVEILFSYSIPVAAKFYGENPDTFKTAEKHSVTTSKHINGWLNGSFCRQVPQSYFDEHLKVVVK